MPAVLDDTQARRRGVAVGEIEREREAVEQRPWRAVAAADAETKPGREQLDARDALPDSQQRQRHRRRHEVNTRSSSSALATCATFAICLAVFVALCAVTYRGWSAVPPPKPATAPASEFSGERALQHVRRLAGFAIIGSKQLLVSERYIFDTLQSFVNAATASGAAGRFRIDLHRQNATGAYDMDCSQFGVPRLTNAYANVTNIVLRIAPPEAVAGDEAQADGSVSAATAAAAAVPRPALAVNSHYDTACGSPGASDALSAIGIMLEMARAILLGGDGGGAALKSPVVFLFNGAEESLLQGSHGFVSSHPFMREVAALLNLESAGGGVGPEMLFRTGPNNEWLARAYARAAPYPHAAAYVQDVFERNWVPAETDFRIFQGVGDVPGLDLATYHHGYVYHTEYDEAARIDAGHMQHYGENALAIVKDLVGERHSLRDAVDPAPEAAAARARRAVYFDVLGKFVVIFSADTA